MECVCQLFCDGGCGVGVFVKIGCFEYDGFKGVVVIKVLECSFQIVDNIVIVMDLFMCGIVVVVCCDLLQLCVFDGDIVEIQYCVMGVIC